MADKSINLRLKRKQRARDEKRARSDKATATGGVTRVDRQTSAKLTSLDAKRCKGIALKRDPTATMVPDRPKKRSLTLQGHRTSVSLEAPFWDEFQRLAKARGVSVNALAAELDHDRVPPASLASAIRLFVLQQVKAGR